MAELIAVGTAESAWADFTVPTTNGVGLFLKPTAGSDGPMPAGPEFEVAHKTPAGARVVLIPVAQGVLYAHTRRVADRSPRAYSSAPEIEAARWPSTIAAISNASTILRVCL